MNLYACGISIFSIELNTPKLRIPAQTYPLRIAKNTFAAELMLNLRPWTGFNAESHTVTRVHGWNLIKFLCPLCSDRLLVMCIFLSLCLL